MATEDILMEATKSGGNRQELHEKIRTHSMKAGEQVKQFGLENDLVQRIANDPAFGMTAEEIHEILKPENLTGRAESQVSDYLTDYVYPKLYENKEYLGYIDKNVTV